MFSHEEEHKVLTRLVLTRRQFLLEEGLQLRVSSQDFQI